MFWADRLVKLTPQSSHRHRFAAFSLQCRWRLDQLVNLRPRHPCSQHRGSSSRGTGGAAGCCGLVSSVDSIDREDVAVAVAAPAGEVVIGVVIS